jgi:hypothetical protein
MRAEDTGPGREVPERLILAAALAQQPAEEIWWYGRTQVLAAGLAV